MRIEARFGEAAAIQSSRPSRPGCAIDAMPPASWMRAMTSSGAAAFARHERRAGRARASARTPRRVDATWPAATIARATHGRPDRPARIVERRLQHRVGVERAARGRRASTIMRRTRSTRCRRCSARNARSAGGSRIEEIAEHVDVGLVADRGDLDARDELDAGGRARRGDRLARGDRVVIGDAQHA